MQSCLPYICMFIVTLAVGRYDSYVYTVLQAGKQLGSRGKYAAIPS